MELSRRQFIQSAAIAAFPIPAWAENPIQESVISINLGWGFENDAAIPDAKMAEKVIRAMNYTIDSYDFAGWAKEPYWTTRERNGLEVYKLSCSPYVRADERGQPLRKRWGSGTE